LSAEFEASLAARLDHLSIVTRLSSAVGRYLHLRRLRRGLELRTASSPITICWPTRWLDGWSV